jgi:hypothetical protein
MAIMYVDIPYLEIKKYTKKVKYKKKVCKILPRARFWLDAKGDFRYGGLVCSTADMGGLATGVGVSDCRNCKLKRERYVES